MVGGFDYWFLSLYLLQNAFCISGEVLLLFVLLLVGLFGFFYVGVTKTYMQA